MDGACQLTFIKQAIKQQITGLYGFIIWGTLNHSGGAGFSRVRARICVRTVPSAQPSTERADGAFRESKKETERELSGSVSSVRTNKPHPFHQPRHREKLLTMFTDHYPSRY